MEIFKAIVLGVIQGLTEFLPISSSGHLVIFSKILDFNKPGITFEVFLHVGTLVAVVIAFRKELLQMVQSFFSTHEARKGNPELNNSFQWNIYVIVATVPIVIVGLLFKDTIDVFFDNVLITYSMLFVTGILMTLTQFVEERGLHLNCPKSLAIGIAQSAAIMPGLSRSGSTIFTGMALGIDRVTAARFSFIMSIPAILGAVVLDMKNLFATPLGMSELSYILSGTLAATISGYLAIVLLMRIVKKGKLAFFGYYCFFVSTLGFAFHFLS